MIMRNKDSLLYLANFLLCGFTFYDHKYIYEDWLQNFLSGKHTNIIILYCWSEQQKSKYFFGRDKDHDAKSNSEILISIVVLSIMILLIVLR